MALTVGREVAAPLLLVNLVLYDMVMAFFSSVLNHYINGETYHQVVAGNGTTFYLMVFAVLASVVGVASKLAGVYHVHAWRHDGFAAAALSATVVWSISPGPRGGVEGDMHRRPALVAVAGSGGTDHILAFTQLLYVLLHAAASH